MFGDLILYNGKIHTIDEDRSVVSCAVIKNGKYIYIGDCSNEILTKYKHFEHINLEGKIVLPAFIDAHEHNQFYASQYYGVNLSGYNDIRKYQNVIKEYLSSHPDARIVRGFGWFESLIPVTGPAKEDLDLVSKDIPIVLKADSGHSYWVNSKALEMASITKETPDIEGGVIQRNINGEPSGVLREKAMDLVDSVLEDFSVAEYKEAFRECARMFNRLGVIGVMDASLHAGSNAIEAYKEMAKDNSLSLYVRGTYTAIPDKDIGEQIKFFKQCRNNDYVNESFYINTVKIFADGIIEGKTGYLIEPYKDNDDTDMQYRSAPVWKQEELNEIIAEAMENEFQVHVHCIGDAAVKETLNSFELAIKTNGLKSYRNTIAHIELINPEDLVRMQQLDIIALLNPFWAEVDDLYFSNLNILGKERADRTWPIQSFLNHGVKCAAGSDYPITDIPNPLTGIEIGITRTISKYYHIWASKYETGKYDMPLGGPKECADIDSMVEMFTIGAAYSTYMNDFTGSIEVGKNGDFIILDQDIYNIPYEEISGTKVLSTYMRGRKVFG